MSSVSKQENCISVIALTIAHSFRPVSIQNRALQLTGMEETTSVMAARNYMHKNVDQPLVHTLHPIDDLLTRFA